MEKKCVAFTLRIPAQLLDKMREIAEENGRSLNREIEQLLKKHVSEHEQIPLAE